MEKLVRYIIGICIPIGFYLIAIALSESIGIGARTSTLNKIGFKIGINTGVAVLVFIGILSFDVSRFFYKKYYTKKIKQDIDAIDLCSGQEINSRIDTYPISNDLKLILKQSILRKL